MIYILAFIAAYLAGVISFYAFDCFFGMGKEWADPKTFSMSANYICTKCNVLYRNSWSLCNYCEGKVTPTHSDTTIVIASLLWFVYTPYVILASIFKALNKVNSKRLVKESQKEKIRIAVEKEIAESFEELEKDIYKSVNSKVRK